MFFEKSKYQPILKYLFNLEIELGIQVKLGEISFIEK